MEFKPDASAPRFFNLFSVSVTPRKMVLYYVGPDNTALLKGVALMGEQFYVSIQMLL